MWPSPHNYMLVNNERGAGRVTHTHTKKKNGASKHECLPDRDRNGGVELGK